MQRIENQIFLNIKNVVFTNSRQDLLKKYDKNMDKEECIKNRDTLVVGEYLIIFVDSETWNRTLATYIEKCLMFLPNIKEYNYIVSGNETGLRINMLKRILEAIFKDIRLNKDVNQINYYKLIQKIFK